MIIALPFRIILTFEALERLKHLDEFDRAQDIRVLRSDLNNDLQVLADVDAEHLLHASEGLFCSKLAEVIDEPLVVVY